MRQIIAPRGPARALVAAAAFITAGSAFGAPPEGVTLNESPARTVQLDTLSDIRDSVLDFESDHRVWTAHLTFLANDFMDGRVPGSRGAEIGRQYADAVYEKAGLVMPFEGENGPTWRQAFDLGGRVEVTGAELTVATDSDAGPMEFTHEEDYVVTGLGGEGLFEGEAVFVGYSIDEGGDGFTSYPEDLDLSGKAAVMLRFEPMDDAGRSAWTQDGTWSAAAGFDGKLRAAFDRGAEAVVVINTPGAADGRIERLDTFRSGRTGSGGPAFLMTPDAGTKWLEAATGKAIEELVAHANEGAAPVALAGSVTLEAAMERDVLQAENIGGLLPGKGDLADEYIVIGGHIDHIGMGNFGSRWGSGKLHPGADDNASGTAAVLLLADLLSRAYGQLPDDADARSILFLCFDAEESGLNGSRYYVTDPIAPIQDHVLMINFDMVGRILDDRLLFSGLEFGEGLQEIVQPAMDATELELVIPDAMNGASDHSSFLAVGVPILFSIIADFHDDYHTPDDVAWKINTEGGTKTSHLYYDIAMLVATAEDRPTYTSPAPRAQRQQGGMGGIRVRFGIAPQYSGEGQGIGIGAVTPDGPAAKAGVQEGDRLVRWDGQKLSDVEAWMPLLARHEPGDVVNIGVLRDGEEITLEVTLEGR